MIIKTKARRFIGVSVDAGDRKFSSKRADGECYHVAVKRILLAGLVVLLVLTAAAGAAVGLAPFQTSIALRRLALWRGGVRGVVLGPLLAYEKNGCREGAPCRCVALVHGLGDSAMTWDKILLDAVPPEGTLMLAVDLPGTDGSPSATAYGIRAQARVLRSALQSRCPRWTVAGNSLGGWIAGWLAVDWPDGVERLVLVNAAGLSDLSGLGLEAVRTLSEPTAEGMKLFSARAYANPLTVPDRVWPAVASSIRARPVRAIVAALKAEDLLDARLKDIEAETVIVWGSADRVLPAEFAERFNRGLRGARLKRIPGCGHLPQQECPESVRHALFGS